MSDYIWVDSLTIEAQKLTETPSIDLVQKIKFKGISTPLRSTPISTAYVEQGEGEIPILCLHGFDSSLLEFRRLLPLLAEENKTFAVDFVGFGFSDRALDIPFNPESIKLHLFSFWETQIKKPMVLIGASMGGAAALDFTLTYPQAVEKLILLDSAGIAKTPILWKLLIPPLDRWATNILKSTKVRENISRTAYFDKSLATPDATLCASLHLLDPHWNPALTAFAKSGGYGSYKKQLKDIKQPTLILWGKQDGILGTKDAAVFHKEIPNNQLVWIENCGHVPHLEQPQKVAEYINKFMGSNQRVSVN